MGAADVFGDLSGAGFRFTLSGEGRLIVSPASALTDAQRDAIRAHRDALVDAVASRQPLLPEPWTEGDIARFEDRRARLLRWGWGEAEAERLAERLVRRDREGDDRVSCTDCRHYRAGRCGNHERAGLRVPDVGRDLASMLQRCEGFETTR